MPAVVSPPGDWLSNRLKAVEARLKALEHQQNWAIVDSNGITRLQGGMQSDGTYGIRVFDSSGNPECVIGDLGGGVTEGPYGVAVLPGGTAYIDRTSLQRVGGAIAGAQASATATSTSGLFVPFTGPTGAVTATIGPSGKALVTVEATIGTGGPGNQGEVAISIDGGAAVGPSIASSVSGSGVSGLQTSGSVARVLTGISQGSHSFAPVYEVNNAGTIGFTHVIVTVQPL